MSSLPAKNLHFLTGVFLHFITGADSLNSSGDTIASMMVTRMVEGKDWLKKHLDNSALKGAQ